MKPIFLFTVAVVLTVPVAAVAKPGNGHANGHGYGHDAQPSYGVEGPVGYGVGGCPPGLAKKGCMPPGQARKLLRGQRLPNGFGTLYGYREIPSHLRLRYDLNPYDRYYYDGGYLYRVDPNTMVVQQVIAALLHR